MARPLNDDELLALVNRLADGGWHSGETIAVHTGITRAALAKRVSHLREWGLAVETQAGLGYRFEVPVERLVADKILAALSPVNRAQLKALAVVPRTDSTNQRLIEADAAQDPQVLFAEMQTAGRGRRGREWRSPFGANLYLSLAWGFDAWPPQLGTLPLAVGVTCARALRGCGLADIKLKWPNDLRIGAAKLGGILIEQRGEVGGACRVVIGVGLNVSMTPAQAGALDQPWISVADACARIGIVVPSRNALAAMLLDKLLDALRTFESSGFSSFVPDWNLLDATAGQRVRVSGAGTGIIEGAARGIDGDGALIVDTGDRLMHMHAGDVSLRIEARAE